MSEPERIYGPTEAAELIDFAPSLLRRYAGVYESLGGHIEKDKRGGRLYTAGQLEHFRAARELVRAGELLEQAMRTIDLVPAEPLGSAINLSDAKQVLTLLQTLVDDNQALREQMSALQAEVQGMRQLSGEGQPQSELERMNRYLHGELERRRLEAEAKESPRPWWRFWKR